MFLTAGIFVSSLQKMVWIYTGLSADIAKILCENIQALDAKALTSDHTLHHEFMQIPNKKPLGVVLISSRETCLRCHSKVLVRKDRPASITVYDDKIGIVPGTHFQKYCSNRGCGYTYYYGYYTTGGTCSSHSSSHTLYEPDWESLPYFISSRETAFSISLRQFNSEIVLGRMSFKQCAEVYNHLHQCDMKQTQECEQ